MKRILSALAVLAAVAAAVITILNVAGRGPRPNLVLISVDTLRPDHLGCYGSHHARTPAIDRLARDGILFTDATSNVPLTLPSHASLLSGLYPITHGIRDNGYMALDPGYTTLAEVLKRAGYSTGAVIGAFVLDSRFGLDQGFDHYDDDLSMGEQPRQFTYTEIKADVVTDKALGWIEQAEEPFFSFIHYYDPHMTYDPPEPFASRYAANPYAGEVAYTDQAIGRLVEALSEQGRLERTMIVFLSDHGEGLGDHGEPGHGVLVYESTLRVPLIVRAPEGSDLRTIFAPGSTSDWPVALVDVFPTLADALGLNPGAGLDGTSLLPVLKGESDRTPLHYFESVYSYLAYRWSPLRGVRYGKWKFIFAPDEELYDIETDPHETRNLAGSDIQRAHDLRNYLARIVSDREGRQQNERSRLNRDDIQKLQALGYISGTGAAIPSELVAEGADPKYILPEFAVTMAAGEDALVAGNLVEAAEIFSRIAAKDPGNPQVRAFRAMAYLEMGRFELARRDYLKMVEIDSTNSTPYFHLGTLAQQDGDLKTALRYYEKARDLVPGSSEALANIGGVLVEMGKPDSGAVVLEETLELDPRNEIALLNLALVYLKEGRTGAAEVLFRRTLEVNPDNTKALVNMSSIFIEKGNMDSTAAYLERASASSPEDAGILANLGNSYRQMGRPEDAERCYLEAIDLEPENKLALFGLAAVQAGRGNTREAESLLRRILVIDPGFTPARQALERISSGP
jgi:arylsulfatase A-like enzyme/Tfp pilus assembly protein PilF